MNRRNNTIQFKRKSKIPKTPIIVLAVVVAAALIAVAVFLISHFTKEKEPVIDYGNCTWSTEGFEKISDAKILNESLVIFTDAETGKKGIMKLDGTVTEEAKHDEFSVISDAWRSKKLLAKSTGLSEYLLLVDVETGTVTTRQYHGLTKPENNPYWEEEYKHFSWHDAKGYTGKVKPADVNLGNGLYPVSCPPADGSRWGYINNQLKLEIILAYEKAMDFSGNIAAVSKGGKWGYINQSGVTVIGFDFESVGELDVMAENMAFSFRNSLAPVKKVDKYGIISASGEAVVNFVFDAILQGENGKYIAKRDGQWGLITVDTQAISANTTTTPAQAATTHAATVSVGYYTVKTSGSHLNLRADANTESTKLGQIPNGASVTVSKAVGGWAYVKYNNLQGWVSSQYLVKSAPPVTAAPTQPSTAPVQTTAVPVPSASATEAAGNSTN